ncbi:MAG: phosphate/phosphite/phosphonate ABC transporter substrate-binding protein [Leptolyngbyaceae cyanobacterium MO_188.B28]|nr:phosphate/phosphite/phosphonate ABC transporter substrate-binding protein [Leptolyngbyaceae cyanobacterium MO_188.B28]
MSKQLSFGFGGLAALALLIAGCTATPVVEEPTTPESSNAATATATEGVTGEPVKFGVLAIDSAVSVNERYGPLIDYLSGAVGRPFELVILSQESQFTQVAQGKVDFTTNNPLAAVQIRRLHDIEFLVTHTRPNTGSEFSGLIVADRDSDIKGIEDLRGKRGVCVAFQTAAAGCAFQIYHLLQKGIDPFTDFSSFVENKSQDNIVLAVLNGSVDVGFIRTGQLEKMVDKGLIRSLDEVRILDPQSDDFFYPHTTDLYPEWPVSALTDTDPDLVEQVRAALLALPPDHPNLRALRADGFVDAVDYSKLDALIEALKLKSWDAVDPS